MFPFALPIDIKIIKKGYYPEGGAELKIKIPPLKEPLKPLCLSERGALKRIIVISGAPEFLKGRKVAERQIAGVKEILGKLRLPLEKTMYYKTKCPGSNICLVAEFENTIIGADNLGKIGKKAALDLLKQEKSKTCIDKYTVDQIIPFLALAKKRS